VCVTIAESKRFLRLDGCGTHPKKFGTDGLNTTKLGCTGVHQRLDSPPQDGLGIEATGIMVASSIDSNLEPGGDGKTEDGSDTTNRSQLSHRDQEEDVNAESSTKE